MLGASTTRQLTARAGLTRTVERKPVDATSAAPLADAAIALPILEPNDSQLGWKSVRSGMRAK